MYLDCFLFYSAPLTSNRIFDEEFYDKIAKIKWLGFYKFYKITKIKWLGFYEIYKIAKIKCREISPFKKREIKLSRKFAVIRYTASPGSLVTGRYV